MKPSFWSTKQLTDCGFHCCYLTSLCRFWFLTVECEQIITAAQSSLSWHWSTVADYLCSKLGDAMRLDIQLKHSQTDLYKLFWSVWGFLCHLGLFCLHLITPKHNLVCMEMTRPRVCVSPELPSFFISAEMKTQLHKQSVASPWKEARQNNLDSVIIKSPSSWRKVKWSNVVWKIFLQLHRNVLNFEITLWEYSAATLVSQVVYDGKESVFCQLKGRWKFTSCSYGTQFGFFRIAAFIST